jgi:ferritin-like metal-binding protein YciE
MAEKTLDTLFHDTLKDIYYAERKILKIAAQDAARGAVARAEGRVREAPSAQTEGQIERLQQVFEIIGKPARRVRPATRSKASWPRATRSPRSTRATAALDAGLLAAAQAVEHYEITRYGTLEAVGAIVLGLDGRGGKLLDETLQEESQTDEDLTKIADAAVNTATRCAKPPKARLARSAAARIGPVRSASCRSPGRSDEGGCRRRNLLFPSPARFASASGRSRPARRHVPKPA